MNNKKPRKLKSLSIFFPFYNDEGTVEKMINEAYKIGRAVSDVLEVIAIHGGNSKDKTLEKIKLMQKKYSDLKIIDKTDNWEGYAVIKYGFQNSTKDWIFYTDGDAQYSVKKDLESLVEKELRTGASVVNGYKRRRGDDIIRVVLGNSYAWFSKVLFRSPIRDMDCDFRLIKRNLVQSFKLDSHDASILPELIIKLKWAGADFAEVPVSHFNRKYGQSNYTPFSLFKEKFLGDIKLFKKYRKKIIELNAFKYTINEIPKSESKILRAVSSDNYRMFKYASVGVSSVVIQNILFNILIVFAGISPSISTVLSDQLVILTSYILNNKFTFKDKSINFSRRWLISYAKYYLVIITSTLFQAGMVYIGGLLFGGSLLIANVFFFIGIAIGFVWNYFLNKTIVWRIRKIHES